MAQKKKKKIVFRKGKFYKLIPSVVYGDGFHRTTCVASCRYPGKTHFDKLVFLPTNTLVMHVKRTGPYCQVLYKKKIYLVNTNWIDPEPIRDSKHLAERSAMTLEEIFSGYER